MKISPALLVFPLIVAAATESVMAKSPIEKFDAGKGDPVFEDLLQPSVTVVVPALARDVGKLTRLKHSMDIQTLAPNEVIVVISGILRPATLAPAKA